MKNLILKMFVLGIVMLVLLIANVFVSLQVGDRGNYRQEAEKSMAQSMAGEQQLAGMVLEIPYTERYTEIVKEDKETKMVERKNQYTVYAFPNKLTVSGDMALDPHYRGIFKSNGYIFRGKINGDITLPSPRDIQQHRKNATIEVGTPRLLLAISDPRGIRKIELLINGKTSNVDSGTGDSRSPFGLSSALSQAVATSGENMEFSAKIQLAGIRELSIVPLGTETATNISSPWQHPSFGGDFLPVEKQISAGGFEATWSISALASSAQQAWIGSRSSFGGTTRGQRAEEISLPTFSVALIEPIDIYRLSDRATKYALLFIVLTIGAFLVLEVIRNLRIHPLNYLLIGFAQLIFFVLLLALSEHIGFDLAYLIAGTACVLLISFYVTHLLRSILGALGFGAGLAVLYTALYFILQSEQNSLLMGSLLLFFVLAGIMVSTRKIDWYQVFNDAINLAGTQKKALPAEK